MYVTFLCCSLLQFSSFIGFLTYKPKYMEMQYGQSASKSNFLIGELHCSDNLFYNGWTGRSSGIFFWDWTFLNLKYMKAACKLVWVSMGTE